MNEIILRSKIKLLMKERGLTVRGLIENTGLANETILRARDHRIESCSLATLAKIAQALGVQVKDLFEE